MSKARNIFIATAGALVLAGAITATAVSGFAGGGLYTPTIVNGVDKTTTITLDSDNKPTFNAENASLKYNNYDYATFTYTNASSLDDGHVHLGSNGTIVKNQASNGLVSFRAVFKNGALTLTTGYTGSDDICYEYSLTSDTLQEVHGNYFKLKTDDEGVDITEIEIIFGCETAENASYTFSDEWTTNETHHWHASTDQNCVIKDSYGPHVEEDIPMIEPTKELEGSYNGKRCSVCGETLVEPTILPRLSATDYDISYRTAMINDQVRDSETYTLKADDSVSIDVGYGDTVYTEYIHAGNSYYSLKRWNELFPDAQAAAENGILTITLSGNTTVTAEAGGNLDGNLDLLLYDSVIVKGNGALTVQYATEIDGIEAWNFKIQDGATVNLIGASETRKTGFKVYGTLQIDGAANVSQYGYAVGFNNDKAGSKDKTFELNIGSTGALNIDQARDGIHVWGTPTGGCTFNISGTLNIDASEDAIQLETKVYTYFTGNASVTLNAGGAGIYNHDENGSKTPDNRFWFQNNAEVSITTTNGCGIKLGNIGRIYVQDSSKLSVVAGSSGINGYLVLCVCNGDQDTYSKNSASLIVKTNGLTSGTHAMTSNPIHAREGDWCGTVFNTDGEVLIEKIGASGSTGIHLGGKKSSALHFRVLCTNMTIKNCSNAIGCWVSPSLNLTYTYSGDYKKINVINCNNIWNDGCPSGIKSAFAADNVNKVNIPAE